MIPYLWIKKKKLSKTTDPHTLIVNVSYKINWKKSNKYVALSNLSIYIILISKKVYKLIVVDLSKQQGLDSGMKAIQQTNLIANLERSRNTTKFFILEEVERTVLNFWQGTVKLFGFYLDLTKYRYNSDSILQYNCKFI